MTRRAPRGASRRAACTPPSCSACARPRATSAPSCRCTQPRSSRWTSAAMTWSSRAPRPGRTPCMCDDDAVHVSYCHNPFRYAWNDREQTLARRRDPVTRAFLRGAFSRWRQWDRTRRPAHRPLRVQLGHHPGPRPGVLRARVQHRLSPGGHQPLRPRRRWATTTCSISELMPHKRIDIAVAAFNRLRLPLIVIGDGPEAGRLQPGRGAHGAVRRPRARPRGRAARQLGAGAHRHRGRGVRHRVRGEPGGRAARDRPARRRLAGDDHRRRDRAASGPGAPKLWPRPCSPSTTRRSTRPRACAAPRALTATTSPPECWPRSRPRSTDATDRPGPGALAAALDPDRAAR